MNPEGPRIENPLLRGMYPDPSVCRVDGVYYLATSTFEYLPGIPIHTSTDLANWNLAGHAIHDPRQVDFTAVGDSRGMFAPTIRHHDGVFYIACTQVDGGEPSGNFYVTATDVAGPWSEPVFLPDARGIDPSLFFHDGRVWWVGCREVAEPTFDGETEVWLRELDLARQELVGPETVIWTRTQYRAVWAEAPHLLYRDGWFYLLTAEGGTAFEHSVMIARSRDVAGPYLPCPRNPILTHRHLGHAAGVQAVGHADLFEGEPGEWWMVVLATRPVGGHTILGRETHLARVEWEDDWPVVNPGSGVLDAPLARTGQWGSAGVPAVEDFLAVRGFPFSGFTEVRPDHLLLRSTGHGFDGTGGPAALLRRLTSTDSTVSIDLDALDRDAAAGLILRQSDAAWVAIELTAEGDALRVRLLVNGVDHTPEGTPTLSRGPEAGPEPGSEPGPDADSGPATLTARVTPEGISYAAGSIDLGSTPLAVLSTETAGGFVGTTWGPYVTGPRGTSVAFASWQQHDLS